MFLDTPGHARHHHSIFDARSRSFFTGDSFGISYRELDVDGAECVFPTTTPTQFDPQAAHATIDRLMSYAPQHMFLTHYSRVGHTERLAADLHRLIDGHSKLAERVRDAGAARDRLLEDGVRTLLLDHVAAHGCRLSRVERADGDRYGRSAQRPGSRCVARQPPAGGAVVITARGPGMA